MDSSKKQNRDLAHIHNPHDRFVQGVYSSKETAIELFQDNLPTAIVRKIQWNQLALKPGRFIDYEMAKYESDLLYQVPFADQKAYLYL